MRFVFKIVLLLAFISNSVYSQSMKEGLFGSWVLNSICEFPDIIILRSDHKYFVYNSSSSDIGSYELTGKLKSNDIRINGAYTSMTEKGTWDYNFSTKELILKERNILEEWTDFSEAYGNSIELRFRLNQLDKNTINLCVDNQGGQQCDEYEKTWSYTIDNGTKVFYREVAENYIGKGSQMEEIFLSGYETELKLSYEFYKEADQLTITDKSGKELFTTEMITTNRERINEIALRGVTQLILKVDSSNPSSQWKVKVEVK